MADTDMINVTFKTQKVWHDGTSMIVAKAGDTKPVTRARAQTYIDDKSIDEPEGWEAQVSIGGTEFAISDGSQMIATGPIPLDGDAPAGDDDSDDDDAADSFDHDGDGSPGGSEPHDPPALTGKNKAQLLEIAADEGVEVEDGATKAQIVEAIEAARADNADGDDDAPAS